MLQKVGKELADSRSLPSNTTIRTVLQLFVLLELGIGVSHYLVPSREYFQTWLTCQQDDRLLFYEEGVGATVAVPQHIDGIKDLTINGSTTVNSTYGISTYERCSLQP
jgi:hypothetical protein